MTDRMESTFHVGIRAPPFSTASGDVESAETAVYTDT